jgi:hypothetical protein
MSTVQMPQSPTPQPYFVPLSASTSRSAQSNGMSGSAAMLRSVPLMTMETIPGSLSARYVPRGTTVSRRILVRCRSRRYT